MDPMIQPNGSDQPPTSNDQSMDNTLSPEPTPPEPTAAPTTPTPAPAPLSESPDTKAGDLYPPATTPGDSIHPDQSPAAGDHAAPPLPKHGGTPVAAVIIAIVIALALAGLTVYAYLKSRDTSPSNTTTSQTPTTAQTTKKATTADVDKTSSDLDSALNSVDDTKDFASTDLSDTSLGL